MAKRYTPSKSEQEKLDKVEAAKPKAYVSDNKADKLANTLLGSSGFSYDPQSDAAYVTAKKDYRAAAKQAMDNTLASSSALTGGYGNSWGQMAAQGEYDRVMRGINDIIPELYEAAYQRYADSRAEKFRLLEDARESEKTNYSRYRDDIADWQDARDYYYQLVRDDILDQKDEDELEFGMKKVIFDNVNRLL